MAVKTLPGILTEAHEDVALRARLSGGGSHDEGEGDRRRGDGVSDDPRTPPAGEPDPIPTATAQALRRLTFTEAKLFQLQNLVRQMRARQRSYFKTRTPDDMYRSKELEAQVDKLLEPTKSLFDQEGT